MRKVKIDAIKIDGGTQCRLFIDQQTVNNYVEAMKDGDEFPLIETVFDGATHWLTDGFHRYHAYKILGLKEVEVKYKPGIYEEARIEALKANSRHGKPLTNEDKRNKVEMALLLDGFQDKSNYEIAKICGVSQPFVASIRSQNVSEKQEENRIKNAEKKAKKNNDLNLDLKDSFITQPYTNPISSVNTTEPDPYAGELPSEEEIRIAELAEEADKEILYKLLESDDALATAHEEIKRLTHQNAQLEIRLHGLMTEKNEAVKMVKDLQKQIDKFNIKK